MQEVEGGAALPGLYPPNDAAKARYAAQRPLSRMRPCGAWLRHDERVGVRGRRTWAQVSALTLTLSPRKSGEREQARQAKLFHRIGAGLGDHAVLIGSDAGDTHRADDLAADGNRADRPLQSMRRAGSEYVNLLHRRQLRPGTPSSGGDRSPRRRPCRSLPGRCRSGCCRSSRTPPGSRGCRPRRRRQASCSSLLPPALQPLLLSPARG